VNQSEAPVETVTLTIDGVEVSVPKGTLIIRAAEQLGTIVPRFCDHPLLDPVGACRQCVVEVEGQPKPVMSCTQPVAPDMVVRTHRTSEVARKGQEGTLEFLLINHPLDCPMCDKGGECPLQDQALKHGSTTSRFIDQKRRYDKPVAISEQILLDRERCVLCARCTRFAEQVPGDAFIELYERGALEQVAIYEDEPFHSYFSGNIIQICPVGALTSTDYRFRARPFDVVTTPSVCDHCSAGCTLTVQSRRGDIQRQLARTNMPVNEAWSCDKGRFGFHHLTVPGRVTEPHVRDGDELVATSWTEALERSVDALRAAGPGRVAVLTGSRLADEDAYLVAKYTRTVLGSDDLDHRTSFAAAGESADLAALIGRDTATYADVEQAPVVVVAGLDAEEEVPILHLRLRKGWRRHQARLVVIGPHLGTLRDIAWRHVPCLPGQAAGVLDALAAGGGPGLPVLDEVAVALRAADRPVVLVGERAGAGAVRAGAGLAASVGGKMAHVPRRAGARGALQGGLAAGVLPGGRRLDDAADRAEVEAVWGTGLPSESGRDLHQVLVDAAAGRIDVLHLIGVDLAADAASTDLARRALARVPTVIVQDLAATPTLTEFADVVLPVAGRQERAGSATNWEGRTQQFQRAVDAPNLAQEDWQIVVQLAALLGTDLGVDGLQAVRAEMERLGTRATPHDFVPAAVTDDALPGATDDLQVEARPLLLSMSTMLAGANDLLATAREPVAELGPATAGRLGLNTGDQVVVRGPEATWQLPVVVHDDVVDGVVVLPTRGEDRTVGELADDSGRSGVVLERLAGTPAATGEVA